MPSAHSASSIIEDVSLGAFAVSTARPATGLSAGAPNQPISASAVTSATQFQNGVT
jgi:hypothetical protein